MGALRLRIDSDMSQDTGHRDILLQIAQRLVDPAGGFSCEQVGSLFDDLSDLSSHRVGLKKRFILYSVKVH